ncbi:excinuclease ABC subunit C [Candidatus Kuenenbacteria bacterium CG08_land_8_20_14_0_20_37_23]|uniref:Excinuclease ABC subunit C n=1 Tax=Candidatus Kuenenbacteria bacterium CG08_land_8_20_14_0_20_37_23 TaxID=1974617 RepID=A0A2M6XSF2_9BACT|nr:MAG: excinuclease ABC subunit C [Candidatus Kuenenbacteria bacterium CG08_land_8_20_14_0_20_37_23]
MHYVYVLQRKNNEYYIGYTSDLQKRFKEHQREGRCGLLYYEAYLPEKVARDRERKLKHYGSAWRALKKRISA